MHRFLWFPPADIPAPDRLRGAHLVGADGVAVRGETRADAGAINCTTRSTDAIGLSLLWPVRGRGLVQLETTRLLPREEPYHLHIELARQRLLRLSIKREEWGLYDYAGMESIGELIDKARDAFSAALESMDDPPRAAGLADESLMHGLAASDEMCRFHAGVFLGRRQQSNGFSRGFLGVALPAATPPKLVGAGLNKVFDHVRLPLAWRDLQPKEQGASFEKYDALVKAAVAARLTIRGGPLLNLGVQAVPDWMYLYENDYESLADFAKEHIRRTVQRYASKISSWVAVSGLHADSVFPLTFEQVIDLTRLAVTTVKQAAPRANAIVGLTQPWGEYYARNQQTIPPLLYAEMVVQSAIPFDAFGLQLLLGIDSDGFRMRDLLQIGALVDRLANLGKVLHVTAIAVPSKEQNGGHWLEPWSEGAQADWLAALCEVLLSRPYVESVCLHALTDPLSSIPHGGLVRDDLTPKPALQRLAKLRGALTGEVRKS